MIITREFLKEKEACVDSFKYVCENNYIGLEAVDFLNKLISETRYDDANWLIVRVMTRPQYLAYAIYAAEQVIDIFEKKCPKDKRPRAAIEAARRVLANDTEENRKAARVAGSAARVAGSAAWAAGSAARAASWEAARAAGSTSRDVAWEAARDAAWEAARAAAWDAARADAWEAAWDDMLLKILNYGLSLFKEAGDESLV